MRVSIDSRTIQPGDYFIPVKGPRFDGRDFIAEVIQKGGHVLDVDLFDYAKKYRKKLTCKVVVIVGSAGKTTVKDMLAGVLSSHYKVTKTLQNQNNEYGVPLTVLAADDSTDILLVEMGLRKKGDLLFLTRLVQPDMVVFTGVGKSHIEFFKSQRQLALAKADVFQAALTWQKGVDRQCFLNGNSDFVELVQTKAIKAGYQPLIYTGDDKVSENINACFSVGGYFGLSQANIEQGVQRFKGSDHRMVTIKKGAITLLDDTYNSNPSGLLYAFQYFRRFEGRKIAVLGDMLELGRYSEQEHKNIKQWGIDNDIELFFLYGTAMRAVDRTQGDVLHYEDLDQLNDHLLAELKPGDVVLIKGSRGLKMERTVAFLCDELS